MLKRRITLIVFLAVLLASVAGKARSATNAEPKAYAIAEITVTDPEAYKLYLAAVTPVVTQFSGKYIVRAGTVVPIEGDAPTGRVVVIEFPNLNVAKSFESSAQYLAIAPLRQRASRTRLFLVEGTPQ